MTNSAPDRPFASVWFDCDSTLAAIEGIDELGALRDTATRARIATLTDRAMSGELPLAEVYEARLRELAPTADECASIGARYVDAALPDAGLVIAALHHLDKRVGIVSGGLLPPVLTLARHLGVPDQLVHAVPIRFDDAGRYADFDRQSPLWRNGGKTAVLGALPQGLRPICFVGDGVTDLEALPVVERFVGFGGIARRVAVERGCDFYTAEPRLAAVLPFALTGDERERLATDARFASLFTGR